MSTFDMVFVGMVIAGMASLMAALGWACWYTRDTPSRQPAATTVQDVQPDRQNRLAA